MHQSKRCGRGSPSSAKTVEASTATSGSRTSQGARWAAQAFYGGLFGWTFTPFEGEQPYFTIQNGERTNGGMRSPQPGEPPNWLVYFATEDTDASVAKVEELGGTKMIEPFDFPMGRIGIVADPQGAAFAFYAGQLDP
jgi:uncharacterized protein